MELAVAGGWLEAPRLVAVTRTLDVSFVTTQWLCSSLLGLATRASVRRLSEESRSRIGWWRWLWIGGTAAALVFQWRRGREGETLAEKEGACYFGRQFE